MERDRILDLAKKVLSELDDANLFDSDPRETNKNDERHGSLVCWDRENCKAWYGQLTTNIDSLKIHISIGWIPGGLESELGIEIQVIGKDQRREDYAKKIVESLNSNILIAKNHKEGENNYPALRWWICDEIGYEDLLALIKLFISGCKKATI